MDRENKSAEPKPEKASTGAQTNIEGIMPTNNPEVKKNLSEKKHSSLPYTIYCESQKTFDNIMRRVNKHEKLVLHLRNVCNSYDSISFDARKGKALEFLANIGEK